MSDISPRKACNLSATESWIHVGTFGQRDIPTLTAVSAYSLFRSLRTSVLFHLMTLFTTSGISDLMGSVCVWRCKSVSVRTGGHVCRVRVGVGRVARPLRGRHKERSTDVCVGCVCGCVVDGMCCIWKTEAASEGTEILTSVKHTVSAQQHK